MFLITWYENGIMKTEGYEYERDAKTFFQRYKGEKEFLTLWKVVEKA